MSGAVCLLPMCIYDLHGGNVTFILLPHHFVLSVTYLLSTCCVKRTGSSSSILFCISVSVLNVRASYFLASEN